MKERALAWLLHYWQSGCGKCDVQMVVDGRYVRLGHDDARVVAGLPRRPAKKTSSTPREAA